MLVRGAVLEQVQLHHDCLQQSLATESLVVGAKLLEFVSKGTFVRFGVVPEADTHNLAGGVIDSDVDTSAALEVAVDLQGHDSAELGKFLSAATACNDCHHGGISVECGNQHLERICIFMRLGGADGIGS